MFYSYLLHSYGCMLYQQNSRYIMLQGERMNDWEDTKESAVAQFVVLSGDLPGMTAENHDNSKKNSICSVRDT
jgi:hypothetical protein